MEIKGKICFKKSEISNNILDFLKQFNICKEKVYICETPLLMIYTIYNNEIYSHNIMTENIIIDDILISEMKKCDYLFIYEYENIMKFHMAYEEKRLRRLKKLNSL
ncbi:hypothetical protein M0Q50_03755 [bacterium]|jgi:hypothetical protein|nr:hypothetical protein [bacterium]